MRRADLLLPVLIFALACQAATGQTLLDKVEGQLPKAAGTAPSGAVPGTGYLGAVLDDNMNRGVRVEQVRAGTPAELGGLKAGDVIVRIDTSDIVRMEDLDAILGKAVPGQRLRMSIERGGRSQTVNVMLGSRQNAPAAPSPPASEAPPLLTLPSPAPAAPTAEDPAAPAPVPSLTLPSTSTPAPAATTPALSEPFPAPLPSSPAPGTIRSTPLDQAPPPPEPAAPGFAPSDPITPAPSSAGPSGGASLGIMVDKLNDEARAVYGLTVRKGALIVSVRPDSPAEQAGLPIGGVIVALDGRRIDTDDELVATIRAARPGQEVEITYYQGDRLLKKTVRLASASSSRSILIPESPPGLARRGNNSDRPLLGKVERLVEGLSNRGPSNLYYNPSEMAALQKSVTELTEQVRSLEERLRAIESKVSAPILPPASGFTPGVGNP